MAEALNILYQIYSSFIDLVFNRFEIAENVTIGWILVAITLFGIMITNIVSLPKGVHFSSKSSDDAKFYKFGGWRKY